MVVGTCHPQGRQPHPGEDPLWDLGRSAWVQFFRGRAETRVLPALPFQGWCIIHGRQLLMWFWHIYSHLYCSSRDGGRDLPSSVEAAPTMGKVPCEFWADWPGLSFSGEELRQGSFQPCPYQDGASLMASGSGHNLAHLLTPALLLEGWW